MEDILLGWFSFSSSSGSLKPTVWSGGPIIIASPHQTPASSSKKRWCLVIERLVDVQRYAYSNTISCDVWWKMSVHMNSLGILGIRSEICNQPSDSGMALFWWKDELTADLQKSSPLSPTYMSRFIPVYSNWIRPSRVAKK